MPYGTNRRMSCKTPFDGHVSRLGARDSPGFRNNGRRNVRRDEHPALDRHTRALARRTRQRDTPPARAVRLTQTHNGRHPGPHAYLAPRTCLAITLALACLSLAHLCKACPLPCAPPPARHQPARQGIKLTSTSPPRSSLHHRMPIIEALLKEAERAAASSNSSSVQQQQQQRAAAIAANSSNNSEQQQQRAAGASSSEQQQHRAERATAAGNSSSSSDPSQQQ